MNNKLEKMCKKRSWHNLKFYSSICLKGLSKTIKQLNQVSRSPGRDMNLKLPEYKARRDVRSAGNGTQIQWMIFQVLTAASIKIAPCRLVETHRSFKSLWWWRQYAPLKRRSISTRLHGAMSQKAVIYVLSNFIEWAISAYKFRAIQAHY
jgi:hypothetical protein